MIELNDQYVDKFAQYENQNKCFREALQAYLRPRFAELSEDSQVRFEKNPLRILDSKDPKDKEILLGAPSILECLSPAAKAHFDELRRLLDQVKIPYSVNDRIVRGLDYYNKTVFEVAANVLGAQNAIGGGGRYDGLISSFGGPDLPGVGFGSGIERILQTLVAQNGTLPNATGPLLYLLPLGEEARGACFPIATECRRHHISAEIDLHAKKIQAGLQNATRVGAKLCAIIGSEELAKGIVQLKHLDTREQQEVRLTDLLQVCRNIQKSL